MSKQKDQWYQEWWILNNGFIHSEHRYKSEALVELEVIKQHAPDTTARIKRVRSEIPFQKGYRPMGGLMRRAY